MTSTQDSTATTIPAPSPPPKTFGHDLTTGSIPRHILSIAIPMLLGNFINTGYSIINTIWIGKIIGETAVGAIATSFPVIFIFIGLAAGATMATTILVSQYYGAKRMDMVERIINTSFAISAIMAVFFTIGGILFTDQILRLMGTPPEVFGLASPYLKLTFGGFGFMYMSFLISSILRGLGDTKTPLLFMAAGVVINAVLDPLLIIGIGPFPKMGLNGAAVASIISTAVALVLGIGYLRSKKHVVGFHFRKLTLDSTIVASIFKIGFPSMIQQTLVSVSSAFVTTFINTFGTPAIAGFGAASRIDAIAFMPMLTISMAASAITGQNLGAGKPERIGQLFKWGGIITASMAGFFTICELVFPELLLSMFLNDPESIKIGANYLRIVGLVNIPFAMFFLSNGIVMGSGHTLITLIFTINSLWIFRVPLSALLSKTSLGITGIWLAIDIGIVVTLCMSLGYYASGKWKKPVIKKEKGIPA